MVIGTRHRPDLSLPMPTKFLARPAKLDGAFGLVSGGITNAYHEADLGLNRPCGTFTNHYLRDQGLGIDLSVGEVV